MATHTYNTDATPIKKSFDLWQAAHATAKSMPGDQEAGWCLVFRIAEEIAAMPSQCATDVLYKMMAYTMLGDENFSLGDGPSGRLIWDEALQLMGIAA